MRRLASLRRVPMDTVPRPRRHCQGAATPGSASLGPVDSPSGTMRSREVRGVVSLSRSRGRCGPAPGRGLDCSRRPFPFQRCLHTDEAGPPRFPGDHPVALRSSPTPAGPVRLASGGGPGAAPAVRKQEGTGIACLEAQQVASPPAVHASRHTLPCAMQHALPAGGLRLCRAGVEPAGSRRKVPGHPVLLSRAWPGANGFRHGRHLRNLSAAFLQRLAPVEAGQAAARSAATVDAFLEPGVARQALALKRRPKPLPVRLRLRKQAMDNVPARPCKCDAAAPASSVCERVRGPPFLRMLPESRKNAERT